MRLETKIAIDRYVGCFLIFWLNFVARFLGFVMRRNHTLAVEGDILVIKMLGGGSLVMAFPALYGIRKTYPDRKMRLFTTCAVKPFAQTLGIFDDILVLDDRSLIGFFASGLKCLRTCFNSDTVIDLEIYSYLSTVLSLMTGARNRIGLFFDETGFRQRLHTHRIFFHPGSALYLHYDRIAHLLGAPVIEHNACALQVRNVLGLTNMGRVANGGTIAVGCGCSNLSSERKLTPQQWAHNVFPLEVNKTRTVVFLGAKDDHDEANKVIVSTKAEGSWLGPLKNECGQMALFDSLRLLAGCSEFWGIESSLLQYARLFGLKCKAFLGPTHPTRLRPFDGMRDEIFYRKTICSPCIHLVSTPPCHGNNICMKWLFDTDPKSYCEANWIPTVTDTVRTDHEKL